MAPKSRFADGEKVLCFHGPLLYEAKCLQSEIQDKQMKYFIHYSGWNKNWDEWVPESRILKYNESNLQKQKELTQTHATGKKSKGQKALPKKDKEGEKETSVEKSPAEKAKQISAEKSRQNPAEKPKASTSEKAKPNTTEKSKANAGEKPKQTPLEKQSKSKSDKRSIPAPVPEVITLDSPPRQPKKTVKKERPFREDPEPEKEIKIEIPEILKDWLIDDNDLINRQKKILHLPARVTVDHMIAGFVQEKVSSKGLSKEQEKEFVQFSKELRILFDVSLGKLLLYKFERPQYADILAEYSNRSMSQIYGAIHMLRLISKIKELLTELKITGEPLEKLLVQVGDFKSYIALNTQMFNLKDYEVATPAYRRRAL